MRFLSLIAIFASIAIQTYAFELPSDWSSIRSNIDTSFSCVGRAFGYYADVANDCQVYHVCQPRIENDVTVYTHNPFICPVTTVFDQQALACVHASSEFSCANQVNTSKLMVKNFFILINLLYYTETENRLANVPVETVNVGSHNVVVPPARFDVPVVPVVATNVVNKPVIYERRTNPWGDSHSPVNVDLYGIPPKVQPVLPAENVPVSNVLLSNVPASSVPVSNVRNVVSNDESAEVANVHSVSSAVGVVHTLPVRFSQQNQESVKIEVPRKSFQVTKSIAVPQPKKQIEQPTKGVSKGAQQVQQVQQIQVPVKARVIAQVVKGPVKAPVQQQTQQVVKVPEIVAAKASVARQQTTEQVVEQPRKQENHLRSHVLYNGQPSWRHHYVQLYPHLISNNPYHHRTVTRLV